MFSNIFMDNQDVMRKACCSCGCGCTCDPKSAESSGQKGASRSVASSGSSTNSTPSS